MPRVPVAAVVLGVLLALVASPRAQSGGGRVIQGRVIADDSGDPISNAKVGFATAATARATLTDRDGRFAIDAPPGVARLTIAKAGYARRDVAVPSAPAPADIRLARTAIITGRIVDAAGEPASNVLVRADAVKPDGQGLSPITIVTTDDRGEYRLSGVSAARIAVSVQGIGNPALYFPGVESAADAELFEVKAGDELEAINFALPYAAPPAGGWILVGPPGTTAPPRPAEGTATVRGRVVSATGGVLAGARVSLLQVEGRGGVVSTQSERDGQFQIAGIAPGSFFIAANLTGFSGSALPLGRPLSVTATGADVELTLTPWSSVTGRVLDELGEPVQGASVQLLRLQFQDGRRRLVSVGGARQTDDRGAFRLFAVPPGEYILAASASDVSTAELPGYVRSFYPGVAEAASSPFLSIGAGQSLPGADITLVRQQTARLSGIVRDAQGRPGVVGSLTLIPSQSASSLAAAVGARTGDGGTFEFPNVPPGSYVIQSYRGARNRATEGEFGALPVSVGERDVEGLTVQATAGSAIAGRLSFIGSTPDAAPPRAGIDIEAVPSDPDLAPLNGRATADIRPDWTFTMTGISGPRRLEVTRLPVGWALQEIRARGIDVTDRPLVFGTAAQSIDDVDVVLTDRVTRVSGRVTDGDGRAAAGATVVVFTPSRDRWYAHSRFMRAATAGADGTFRIDGLPAGAYYATALPAAPAGGDDAWRDPSVLESLVRPATTISLGEGASATITLTVSDTR